jgi:alpha-mannosidase
VVFNPTPWTRSEVLSARVWDRNWTGGEVVVTDDEGAVRPAQVTGRGHYWGHRYTDLAFPAADVPAMGYRSFAVSRSPSAPTVAASARGDGHGVIENEFLRVEVEPGSGAITSLVDKRTGLEFVPRGERLGLLEYFREVPHGMTAWVLGQIAEVKPLAEGAVLEFPHTGPWLSAVRARHRLRDSRLTLTISLAAGSPRLDFALEVDWLERGAPDVGVPGLRVSFPLAITEGVARFECPNGHVARPTDPKLFTSYTHKWCGGSGLALYPEDVPAQKWVDLTGRPLVGRTSGLPEAAGATILNDSKYGHSVVGNVMRMTLIRSSYDPDPLPELGHHSIRFAVQPHVGEWTVSDSTRAGYAFNLPLNLIATDLHQGRLPARKAFVELLTSSIMLSALKRAEDSDALILRLYEMEGKATEARIALDPALLSGAASPGRNPRGSQSAVTAVQTDLLERPLAENTARFRDGVLSVRLPAFGLVTVKIG